MSENQRVFPIYFLCLELLNTSYTKSDIKAIGNYIESFPTNEDIDLKRSDLSASLEAVLSSMKHCVNMHGVRSILKRQPIDIKFFIFERISIVAAFCSSQNIEAIQSMSEQPDPYIFVDTIDSLWIRTINTALEHNDSVAALTLKILRTSL